ncbi:MAG: hypothetical protein Q9188_006297 [Gyalolechia gomerana]
MEAGSTSRSSDGGRDPTQDHPDDLVPLSSKALALLQTSKAETGFDSYCAYLDFHGAADPRLEWLSSALKSRVETNAERRCTYRQQPEWIGSVLNVSKSQSHLICQIHQFDGHGNEIIEALCCPPESACLQIVLWNISNTDDIRSQGNLVDFIGLRYRLDPLIFDAILNVVHEAHRMGPLRSRLDRYKPTHVRAGDAIATVCYSEHREDCLPVVLIVGPFDQSSYGLQVKDSADQFGPCPPFSQSPIPRTLDGAIPSTGIYRYYLQLLIPMLEQYHGMQESNIYLPLICILPLLHLTLFTLRCDGRYLRELFDRYFLNREEDDLLSRFRTRLRLRIIDADKDWCRFIKYTSSHFCRSFLEMPFFQDYVDKLKEDTAEAERLESHVRDYLQLQVGVLSLKESRTSIEVSNRQIEESKRGEEYQTLFSATLLTSAGSQNM